ncbi:MAG: hypothetical protein RRY96_06020 [Ruthenibacterium sp.]
MTKEKLGEYLKPIAVRMFGKQGAGPRYQRPQFTIRPLAAMLEDLAQISDENWYRYAFSTEPLNGKFTDEQRQAYAIKAMDCGKTYAQKLMQEYQVTNALQLGRALKMEISYPDYPEKTDRVTFAEFREPNKINIYMDAVRRSRVSLKDEAVCAVMGENPDISNILLAHELFHYVEEVHKKEIYTRTEKINLWHIGPFYNRSTVIAFSEIAAMAFAKELTGISFSPYLLDVFLVYGYSPQEASGLYEIMMQFAGLPIIERNTI